jgi:hypothetical protein
VTELSPELEAAAEMDPAVGIARVDLVRVLAHLPPDDRVLLAP